jgi:hypothetical protein
MTEQPNEQTTSTYEETEEEPKPKKVRVPTPRCASGEFADYVEADEDCAWQWDSRRWTRLA